MVGLVKRCDIITFLLRINFNTYVVLTLTIMRVRAIGIEEIDLSAKLRTYLLKIEDETGRKIMIIRGHVGLPGMPASFRQHPSDIIIAIASSIDINNPNLEHTFAHEATHGFLIYKKGYYKPVFKRTANSIESKIVSILFTMIDDIVVNKIISEEGFSSFASKYFSILKIETLAAQWGKDPYKAYASDPLLRSRFMAYRYISAWGFLTYLNPEPLNIQIIMDFLKSFEKTHPKETKMAKQIQSLILQHDIFTPEGHFTLMKKLLKLWELQDLVTLENI
jgi:hypothetical protein